MNAKTAIALAWLVLSATASAADPPKGADGIIKAHDRAVMHELDDYLRKDPKAEDRDEAYTAIFDRAIEHDWYAEAEPIARRYLAEHPDGAVRPMARIVATMARARAGKFAEALAIYKELIRGLDRPDQEEFAANFTDTLAAAATSAGEVAVARQVYATMRDHYPDRPELKAKIDDDLARLDRVGKAAPTISATDVVGKAVRLADLKGKVVLVDFWATWAAPCLAELPTLQAAYARDHDRGFEILAVSLDEKPDTVVDFAKARRLPWRQLHNATCGQDLVDAFGVTNVPASFLIDPHGTIVRLDPRGPALQQALGRLIPPAR